ncbi:MAG: NAD(P)H-binding protein [Rhizobiales bacterium]|nr:NAD(P)H-binding protein [Hyphomicrobiales bacterium]
MAAVIAVTGATGFAGRHVVAELLRRGHAVRVLARDPSKASFPPGVEIVAGASAIAIRFRLSRKAPAR